MENVNKLSVSDNIGDALESIRSEIRMTKKEFSTLGKISPSYYSDIIKNKKTPNLNSLEKFCENIGVPLQVLIYKAINEQPNESTEKKRLVREIKPYLDKITEILYNDNLNNHEDIKSCGDIEEVNNEKIKQKIHDLIY